MVTSHLHTESKQITSQTQVKAGHLLRLGNHRQVAATRTTSRSLSIKIGAPQSLSRHQGTMYLNTSTCWAQSQQSHWVHTHMRLRCAMKHPALNRKLKVSGSRLPRTARFQMSWKMMTFHHSPWHHDAQEPHDLTGQLVPPLGHHIVHVPPRPDNPVQRTYTGWQEYFDNLHNRSNPNWGNNPMGRSSRIRNQERHLTT